MKGPIGTVIGSSAMRLLSLCELNKLYAGLYQHQGREFTEKMIEEMNVKYDIIASQLENIPQEGPFIIVSNHPFGGYDGILLFNIVSSMRPDFKILTNFILSHIKNLSDSFLPVNPFSDMKGLKNSYAGVRAAKEHIINGGGLGLFPAGEVSTYHGKGYTEDIEWTKSISKLIHGSKVPVIPVYFHGQNSRMFHTLGRIHPLLRTAQLPREMLKMRDKTITMRIGKVISASEISEYDNYTKLGRYLRNRSYALEGLIEKKPQENLRDKESEVSIAIPKSKKQMLEEIERLNNEKCKVFDLASYSCYLADYDKIPAIIHEIGIRREESFREVGEGTGTSIDLDKYDKYYKHLFLWDNDKQKLVGAYRLGFGKDIMERYGKDGFYTESLFHFSKFATGHLSQCIELGRSFVALEYKKEALPLMLLLRGLLLSVVKYPEYKYLIGPVSISSSYPKFYISLMYYYILKKHSTHDIRRNFKSRTPFKPDYLRVSPEDLLGTKMGTVETFDRFLLRLSDQQYRLPTLVKKYLKLGAQIACFNVDKDFNFSVDGLVFLKLSDVPKDEIAQLAKGMENQDEIYSRFGYGTGS